MGELYISDVYSGSYFKIKLFLVHTLPTFLLHISNGRPAYRSHYGDPLPAGRSGDRIALGVKFSANIQTDPGSHPAFYTLGTEASLRANWPERGVEQLTLYST